MKSTAIAAIGITLLGGAVMYAADAPPPSGTSALISDVTVNPNDSPLVRAAKMAVASRAQMTIHSAVVIDNASLRSIGGHISQASGEVAAFPSASAPIRPDQPTPAGVSPADRTRIQSRINDLRREQGVMAEEADQPYGGLVNEDLANKRLTEIPGQINRLQNQLTPPPAPSSPTPQQYPPQQ
jgi:hypothetical protein